jgi:hypothetical protein
MTRRTIIITCQGEGCGAQVEAKSRNRKYCAACKCEREREQGRFRRAADPEKRREWERRRYTANPEKYRVQRRRYLAANREKIRRQVRRRRAANAEKVRDQTRHADAWLGCRQPGPRRQSTAGKNESGPARVVSLARPSQGRAHIRQCLARFCHPLAAKNKSLAQINKSPDVGKATKKGSVLPVNAEWEGPN